MDNTFTELSYTESMEQGNALMRQIPSKQECLDRFEEYFTSYNDDPELIGAFYDWLMEKLKNKTKVTEHENG